MHSTKYSNIREVTGSRAFLSIIEFQTSISNQCKRSYEGFTSEIETALKHELQVNFTKWSQKQWPNQNKAELEIGSVMLSWAIYGAAMHWMQDQKTSPEQYVKHAMPFIKNNMNESISLK